MAKGDGTIGSLAISLRLDLSRLNPDLITAEDTVKQAMAKLNQQAKMVRIQSSIDISNLEGVGTELEKVKAKERELIQLLDIENQKLAIRKANYQQNVTSHGENHSITRSSYMGLLNQERAVASLNAELRTLRESMVRPVVTNGGLVGGLHNVQGAIMTTQEKMTLFHAHLTNALSSSTGMAMELGSAFSSLPGKVGLVAGAMAGVGIAVVAAQKQLVDFIKESTAAGDAMYRNSLKFGLSIKDIKELNLISKFGSGTELTFIVNKLAALDKSLMSVGENGNSATHAMEKFGVVLKNSDGTLKNYKEQILAIADGYNKAKEAGRGAEYLSSIFEAEGITEIRGYLELMEEAREDMAKVDTFIKPIDPKEAHEMQRQVRIMDEEWNRLKASAANALLPIAEELMPEVLSATKSVLGAVKELGEAYKHVNLDPKEQVAAAKVMEESIQGMNSWQLNAQPMNSGLQLQVDEKIQQAEEAHEAAAAEMEAAKEQEEAAKAAADAKKDAADQIVEANGKIILSETELKQLEEKTKSYREEAAAIAYKSTHTSLENQIYDVEQWKEKELSAIDAVENAEEHRAAITELASAKIQEIYDKEAEERERTAKRIESINQSLSDKIFELTHTDTENRLHRLQQEVQKYLAEGADEKQAALYQQLQTKKILDEAEKVMKKSSPGGKDEDIVRPHYIDIVDGKVMESYGTLFRDSMEESRNYVKEITEMLDQPSKVVDDLSNLPENDAWKAERQKRIEEGVIPPDAGANRRYDGIRMTEGMERFFRNSLPGDYVNRPRSEGKNTGLPPSTGEPAPAAPVNLTINYNDAYVDSTERQQKLAEETAGIILRNIPSGASSLNSY